MEASAGPPPAPAVRDAVRALSSLVVADDAGRQCAATRASQEETAASLAAAHAVLSAANNASRQQYTRCAGLFARAAAALKELRADLLYIHSHSKKVKKMIYERHPHLRARAGDGDGAAGARSVERDAAAAVPEADEDEGGRVDGPRADAAGIEGS